MLYTYDYMQVKQSIGVKKADKTMREKATIEKNLCIGANIDVKNYEQQQKQLSEKDVNFELLLEEVDRLTEKVESEFKKLTDKYNIDIFIKNRPKDVSKVEIRFNVDLWRIKNC